MLAGVGVFFLFVWFWGGGAGVATPSQRGFALHQILPSLHKHVDPHHHNSMQAFQSNMCLPRDNKSLLSTFPPFHQYQI